MNKHAAVLAVALVLSGCTALQSVSSLDGHQQVTVASVLPPRELNVTDAPPLVPEMEDAIQETARSMC
ncbi:hypothetical protein ACIQG8_04815 [Pseudarthrobacter oxydans]|uniref:hypothetical protein n=1 Tax=Pseudarthrobacter oxydans TaxID=1671 RepID=UPI0038173E22